MKIFAVTLLATLLLQVTATTAVPSSQERKLALGDFDELNTLFENAVVRMPDSFQVDERVGIARLDMTISNMVCYNMAIGDMSISHTRENDQAIDVDVNIYNLDLSCDMEYVYTYGLLRGDGNVTISTDDNSAFSKLRFTSSNFDRLPPSDSSVDQCAADIEITNLDFEGDLVSEIIEIFQRLIRGVVERQIGEVVCEELGSLGTTLVGNMLDLADQKLEPYIGAVGEEFTDPLYVEKNLVIPGNMVALDLLDSENGVTMLFNQALNGADLFLGAYIADDSQASSSRDLAANVFLRKYFLGEDRAFTVEASELPLNSTLFFDGHDRMFETTMTLNQVKVFGLDTMSVFNPFTQIGRYTLQNELTWDELTVEFDITVDIKPSSLDDAILQDPTSTGIQERITADFGVQNVDVLASLLAVVDEDKLGSIELGSLMQTDDLIPCLLSVMDQVRLVGLDVDPQDVSEPNLNGFISPGLDRVLSDSAEAAFAMYTGVLRESLPKIFQISVRDFLNENIIGPYMVENSNAECPMASSKEGLVNFQEFFGNDESAYGDVPAMLRGIVDSELLSTSGERGTLRLNEALIAPLTERQSGQEGMFLFPGEIVDVNVESVSQFGMESVTLSSFDLRLDNLDSFVAPVEVLQPDSNNQFVLRNNFNFFEGPESLVLGVKGLFSLQGDPVLEMRNEMDFTVNLSGSEAFAAIFAKINANAFLSFPLRDVSNVDCWLSLLGMSMLTEDGNLIEDSTGLSLESLILEIPSMDFSAQCTNCTSSGLAILPEVLTSLEDGGITDTMERRLLNVGLEIVRGEFTQELVNKALIEGTLRCPNSPTYVGREAESDYQVPSFPALSYDSLESLAFVATTMFQMASVIIAESHEGYDAALTSPLSGQNSLDVTSEDRLIDFTALDSSLGEWADRGLEQVLEYLNESIEDKAVESGRDLRINTILRENILDKDGGFTIAFNDLGFGGDDTEMSLKHVRVLGLDSIETLDILDAIGAQTLQNKLRFRNLTLEVVLSVVGTDSPASATKVQEDISISIDLTGVEMSLALLLAMDLDLLGSLQLSSMLEIRNMVPCMLSAAKAAQVTEMEVNVDTIENFVVSGFQSIELSDAAAEASRVILEKYRSKIIGSMPGFFDMTVRALVNNWMDYMMSEWSLIACPTSEFELARVLSFVDFRDLFLSSAESLLLGGEGGSPYGDLFQTVVGFIQDIVFKIDERTGLSAINKVLLAPWTESQSDTTGSLSFPGELLRSDTRLQVGGLDANIELRASDARIDNVDSIGAPLELLQAIQEAHELNNTATFGVGEKPVSLAIRLLLALSGDDDIEVRNELDINVDLKAATVFLQTMFMVDESRFYDFPLRDTLDLNCWLATIPSPELDRSGVRVDETDPTAALAHLAASVAQLNINVSCVECSSPRMSEFAELVSSPSVQGDVTVAANDILEYIGDLAGGNFAQVKIDQVLHDAARKCPHSPLYDPNFAPTVYDPFEAPEIDYSFSYLIMLGGLTLALILITLMVVYVIRCIVRRRHKKWLGNLPPHQIRQLARQQRKESREESTLSESTNSMFRSTEIPSLVRWGIPLLILLNIAFFLSGHLSLGATVNIEAEIAGEKLKVEKFFDFSMARSTLDIWRAGGRELAILIFIFSGVWPYTKQFITMFLWFSPPSRVSVSRRGSILLWLDWLAKWSMVDVFVLVISVAAFRVSIQSPDVSFLPEDFYTIDMMVVPLWGLYANMIAQLISQVSSHFVIHYHRRIVNQAKKTLKSQNHANNEANVFLEDGNNALTRVSLDQSLASTSVEDTIPRQALRKHQFSRPHRGESEKLVVRRGVNFFFGISLVTLAVLVVVGCSIPSFGLDVNGIVGVAIEFGQDFDDAATQHSVFSVLKLLIEEAKLLGSGFHYIGLLSLCLILLITVLFIPILQSLALTRQWFFSSSRKQRNRLSIFIEVLQAWQYAEVYLVAVFVSSWQLGPVSEFMINAYCDNLKDMFAQGVYYGILRDSDAQCFSVQASVKSGSFWLAAGAIILALMNTFVTKAVLQYFRDKDSMEKRISHDGEKSESGLTTASDEEDFPADAGFTARIKPVPVLFTDTFRWLLRPDNSLPASSRALFADPSSDHWDLPEAQAVAYNDDVDGSIIQGQYVSKDYDGSNKKLQYSEKSAAYEGNSPPVATARRRLSFNDESASMYASVMESVSDSQSINSEGWMSQQGGNLKDDLTYATPPGENRIRSQPSVVSATQSVALSAVQSAALSTDPSHRSLQQSMNGSTGGSRMESQVRSVSDGLSLEERQTVEELLQEDEFTEVEVETAHTCPSEYIEETVGDEYEEYTVRTMSDIVEDEEYEEYSEYDSQTHQVV